jgi:hypothetical protein
MDRRAFIGTLAGGLLAAPLAGKAQQGGEGASRWDLDLGVGTAIRGGIPAELTGSGLP